ncbi:hypothetical protein CC85DRAFT_245300, partial [Cutaneotrichosporon oleaginosum]
YPPPPSKCRLPTPATLPAYHNHLPTTPPAYPTCLLTCLPTCRPTCQMPALPAN